MRVLFVYDSISSMGGGSQIACLTWLKNFKKFKIKYKLLTSSYSASFLIRTKMLKKEDMIINHSFNASFILPKFYISPVLTDSIKNQILQFKPDIIQLNEPSLLDFQIIDFARKNKIKVGSFFHTFYEKFSFLSYLLSFYQNYILKNTDFILVPSFNTYQLIHKKYPDKMVFEACYPVKNDFFNKQQNISERFINNQKKTLVYIGRLSPEKKLFFILEIIKLLPSDYQLKIIGDGILKNKLQKEVTKNKLNDKVIFFGYLSSSKIISIIQKELALGIFPSHTETFGIVYIECLASYLPLLVYDYAISHEVIPDGCAAFLNNYDPKLWAKKIIEIFNKNLYLKMKENIKKNYNKVKIYNEDLSTEKLIQTYYLILNKNQ